MEKIIVTAYGKTVKLSDIKNTFMEIFTTCETDPPYLIGAILNDGDVVCMARIRDNDMAALVYNQLRGVINHPELCKDVHNINVEMESLKTVIEVLDSVGKPGNHIRELLLMGALQQLIDGIAPPDSKLKE